MTPEMSSPSPLAPAALALPAGGGKRPRTRVIGPAAAYLTLILLGIVVLTPFLWMISTSLQSDQGLFQIPPQIVPTDPQWHNYSDALSAVPFLTWARNTLVICVLNVIGQLLCCTVVAYGFARLRFPGRGPLFILVLATLLLPSQILLVPQFILFSKLGWVNTFLPLTVPAFFGGGAGAFFIFLIRQYMRTLPYELDEAGRIDGANTWGILFRILLPLIKPPLTIVAVFTFTDAYNDFINPLIYLADNSKYTLALGLSSFIGQYSSNWNWLMCAAVVILLPLLLIYYFAQRLLIGGIASVGLKG
ncbi:MAG TPA: carbohydrate ABC transporter permease [Chloroflexota bacterium]|nr:carbohydrate ABC transporter permease [Chloroflexota bacterium]